MRIASYGQYIPGLTSDYIVRELFNANPFTNLSRELMVIQLYQRTKHIYNDILSLREYLDSNKPNRISFMDANILGNVVMAKITVTSQAPILQNHRSFHVINFESATNEAFKDMTFSLLSSMQDQ